METMMATATITIPVARAKKIPAVRLKNILLATDFSEYSRQTLPYVTGLARKFGSSIYLFHVATPSQLMISAPEAPYLYEALLKKSTAELTAVAFSTELRD